MYHICTLRPSEALNCYCVSGNVQCTVHSRKLFRPEMIQIIALSTYEHMYICLDIYICTRDPQNKHFLSDVLFIRVE